LHWELYYRQFIIITHFFILQNFTHETPLLKSGQEELSKPVMLGLYSKFAWFDRFRAIIKSLLSLNTVNFLKWGKIGFCIEKFIDLFVFILGHIGENKIFPEQGWQKSLEINVKEGSLSFISLFAEYVLLFCLPWDFYKLFCSSLFHLEQSRFVLELSLGSLLGLNFALIRVLRKDPCGSRLLIGIFTVVVEVPFDLVILKVVGVLLVVMTGLARRNKLEINLLSVRVHWEAEAGI